MYDCLDAVASLGPNDDPPVAQRDARAKQGRPVAQPVDEQAGVPRSCGGKGQIIWGRKV